MKWLGLVNDPKDLTTKEYVDEADKEIKESTEEAIRNLEDNKLDSDDFTTFTSEEIKSLWDQHVK